MKDPIQVLIPKRVLSTPRNNVVFWIIISLSFLAPILFTGSMITYDSQFYIESAKSFSMHQLISHYFFARTPGYPFFLFLCHALFGSSLKFVIISQSFLITASTYLLFSKLVKKFFLPRGFSEKQILLIALLIFFQIDVLGYCSDVLEQTLLVVCFNFMIFLQLRWLEKRSMKRLGHLSLSFVISLMISPVMWLPIVVSILLAAYFTLGSMRNILSWKTAISVGNLFIILLLPAVSTNLTWNTYVAQEKKYAPSYNIVNPPGAHELLSIPRFFLGEPVKALDSWDNAYLATSGLIPSHGWSGVINNPSPSIFENRVQAEANFLPGRKCGSEDRVNNSPWVQYNTGYFHMTCANLPLPSAILWILELIMLATRFLWLTWLPLLVYVLFHYLRADGARHFHFITLFLPVAALITGYVLLGAQIDRYALPSYIPLILAVSTLAKPGKNKNHSPHNRSEDVYS